jgi:hypothetical protein
VEGAAISDLIILDVAGAYSKWALDISGAQSDWAWQLGLNWALMVWLEFGLVKVHSPL